MSDQPDRIETAILAARAGVWEASRGELVDGVLVMTPTVRRRRCCGRELQLVAEATRGSLSWGLWRCSRCERSYPVGPKLPPTWVGALAHALVGLYRAYQLAVAAAYQSDSAGGKSR